jgi:hypothetical protein
VFLNFYDIVECPQRAIKNVECKKQYDPFDGVDEDYKTDSRNGDEDLSYILLVQIHLFKAGIADVAHHQKRDDNGSNHKDDAVTQHFILVKEQNKERNENCSCRNGDSDKDRRLLTSSLSKQRK